MLNKGQIWPDLTKSIGYLHTLCLNVPSRKKSFVFLSSLCAALVTPSYRRDHHSSLLSLSLSSSLFLLSSQHLPAGNPSALCAYWLVLIGPARWERDEASLQRVAPAAALPPRWESPFLQSTDAHVSLSGFADSGSFDGAARTSCHSLGSLECGALGSRQSTWEFCFGQLAMLSGPLQSQKKFRLYF